MDNDEYKEFLLELKEKIEVFLSYLDANGLELNEDGDIVEKKSKRLLWDVIHGNNE